MSNRSAQVRDIEAAIFRKLSKFNLSQQHIEYMQYGMVEASLRGVDTHGVRLLKCYLKELAGGRSNALPNFALKKVKAATAVLDADNALGIVAGVTAMNSAIEIASEQGIGLVTVKNSNHFGAASVYSLQAARKGFIGISLSNADALISPFNGTEAMFGTNPISIAAPADNGEFFCLDMACSQVSYSKVLSHLRESKEVPESWMHQSTEEGKPGVLKPLGGYKGAGLAMAVELLTAALTGSPLDQELSHLYVPPYNEPRKVSHLMIAIDISSLIDERIFKGALHLLLESVRNSQQANDSNLKILVPGDKEQTEFIHRTENGIPLEQDTYDLLFN